MDGTVFWVWTCLWLSMTLGWAQSPANLPAEVIAYADMVFYNGQILTVDEQFTITKAVAVRDGKFLAVGDNQRILAMAGPLTRRIDLEGRTVVPGFMDTHRLDFHCSEGYPESCILLVSQRKPFDRGVANEKTNLDGWHGVLGMDVSLAQHDFGVGSEPGKLTC